MAWKLEGIIIRAFCAIVIVNYVDCSCPEFERPPFSTVRRLGNDLVVACNETNTAWFLTCVNNKWEGDVGECPRVSGCPNIRPPDNTEVKITGEQLLVFCPAWDMSWGFNCQDNMWMGVMGICPPAPDSCPYFDYETPTFTTVTRREKIVIITCDLTGELWRIVCWDNKWIGEIPDCPTAIEDNVYHVDNETLLNIEGKIQAATLHKLMLENAEKEESKSLNLQIKQEEHNFYKLRNDLLRQSLALDVRMVYKAGHDGSVIADDEDGK